MIKEKLKIKIIGYVSIGLAIISLILAIIGQINFLGEEREDTILVKNNLENNNSPKYTFYDELKNRKYEINQQIHKIEEKKKLVSDNNTEKQKNKYDNRVYVIQIGAFRKKLDAVSHKKKAENLGYKVIIEKKSKYYLVQVGPIKTKKSANLIEKKLSQQFDTLIKLKK